MELTFYDQSGKKLFRDNLCNKIAFDRFLGILFFLNVSRDGIIRISMKCNLC